MVHRDIKPQNLLLVTGTPATATQATAGWNAVSYS